MQTPYTLALRDLAHSCGQLAGWMEMTDGAESQFTKEQAISYWASRVKDGISRLDSAWEDSKEP